MKISKYYNWMKFVNEFVITRPRESSLSCRAVRRGKTPIGLVLALYRHCKQTERYVVRCGVVTWNVVRLYKTNTQTFGFSLAISVLTGAALATLAVRFGGVFSETQVKLL